MPPDAPVTSPRRARRLGVLLAGATVALGAAGAAWFFRFAEQVRRAQRRTYCLHRDGGGLLDGIAIRSGTDRRERDRPELVLASEPERVHVAASEQLGLAAPAPAPDRPHSVDHVARQQSAAPRDPGLPGGAATDPAAFFQELGPRSAVNRSVHAPTA